MEIYFYIISGLLVLVMGSFVEGKKTPDETLSRIESAAVNTHNNVLDLENSHLK